MTTTRRPPGIAFSLGTRGGAVIVAGMYAQPESASTSAATRVIGPLRLDPAEEAAARGDSMWPGTPGAARRERSTRGDCAGAPAPDRSPPTARTLRAWSPRKGEKSASRRALRHTRKRTAVVLSPVAAATARA